MKTPLAAVILVAATAAAAQGGVNIDVNIGVPPPVVVAPPSPPAPAPPRVVIDAPPRFIYSPALGCYVSVEIPYDVVYIDRSYYLYNGGFWYAAPSYRGPWVVVERRRLPPLLRKYRYEQIRRFRDTEYREYLRDRDHYRGRWHNPEEERRGLSSEAHGERH